MNRDYVIVGGGLAGGLIALAVRQVQPAATITIVERDNRPGGNHTWAFHSADVPAAAECFVRPLIHAAWPGYTVRFPGYERRVSSRYAAVSVERFAEVLDSSGCELLTNTHADTLGRNTVELSDGKTIAARCVIDARGPTADATRTAGYQKFVGLEVELESPWPQALPTVMDATVPQDDGYRFVYTLPFTPTRVLVEETHFADTPDLDRVKLRSRIHEHLRGNGVSSWRVLREESGVLPMPWSGGDIRVDPAAPLTVGYAGGWFQPATGYSFPLAVRLALAVANVGPESAHLAAAAYARRLAPRQRFSRFLNRLLFTLVTPDQRWQVFRRLYRSLPDAVLARFYACEFGAIDAGRLLLGWPPPLSPFRLLQRSEVRPCPSPS